MPEIRAAREYQVSDPASALSAHDNHRTFALAMSNWPLNTTKTPSGRFTIFSPVPWKKSGAFGSVMPARDESSGQDIAIKTADMSNPTNAKIAYDEAQLALTLPQHPNVVHYLACEQTPERVLIAMELGVGDDLFDLIERQQNTDVAEMQRLAQQIIEGLEHLHSANVCHLDIKPDNMILGADGNWKHCDFGTASRGKMQQVSKGTGFYMAPELGPAYSVAATFDGFAADCFSLGVSIYLLLTSNFPFMEHQQRGSDARSHCALRAQQAGKSTSVALLTQLRMGAPAWPQSLLHLVDGFLLFDPSKRLGLADAKKLLRGEKPSLINRIFHFRSAGDDDDDDDEEEEGEVPPPIAAKRCRAKTAKPHAEWADAAAEEAADGEAKPEEAASAPAGEAKAE